MKIAQVIAALFILLSIGILASWLNCGSQSPSLAAQCSKVSRDLLPGTVLWGGGAIALLVITFRRKQGFFAPSSVSKISPQSNLQSTSPAGGTLEAEIQKAKDMLDKGLIDEEEFKLMKKKIIERS